MQKKSGGLDKSDGLEYRITDSAFNKLGTTIMFFAFPSMYLYINASIYEQIDFFWEYFSAKILPLFITL